jgi:hypothetical protein
VYGPLLLEVRTLYSNSRITDVIFVTFIRGRSVLTSGAGSSRAPPDCTRLSPAGRGSLLTGWARPEPTGQPPCDKT